MRKRIFIYVLIVLWSFNSFGQTSELLDKYTELVKISDNQSELIARMKSDSSKLKKANIKFYDKIKEQETKLKDFSELKKNIEELDNNFKKISEDLKDANKRADEDKQTIEDYRLKEQEWDKGELKEKNKMLESVSQKAKEDAFKFKNEAEKKQQTIEIKNEELKEKENKITYLNNQIESLKIEKAKAEEFKDKYEKQVSTLNGQKAKIAGLQEKLSKYGVFLEKELMSLEFKINEFVHGANFTQNDSRFSTFRKQINDYLNDFPENQELKKFSGKIDRHEAVVNKFQQAANSIKSEYNSESVFTSKQGLESLLKHQNLNIRNRANQLFKDLKRYCKLHENIRIAILNLDTYRSDRKKKEDIAELLNAAVGYAYLELALNIKLEDLINAGSILKKVNCN